MRSVVDSNSKRKRRGNPPTIGVNKKNKISGQKTLIASSSSPFTDVASYMEVKNRKLQEQFDAQAASSSSSANLLFDGVSIFVDGYTVPSSQELRGYMLSNGGTFQNYFSRHRVTHIICSNLPASKLNNLSSFSRGLPVVKPTWILDSLAANTLLSCLPYQVAPPPINQSKLSAYLLPPTIPPPPAPAHHHQEDEEEEKEDNNVESVSNKAHFDPSFVETYFKNSRLHFIGTWRNRYRKRFPHHFTPSSSTSQTNTIIHIDMDCFFVSVVIRNRPELWDKPVAVCHSDNPRGTSEISSANYPARDHGVKAGIFVRDAKACSPHLLIVPYDFEAYEEVADQFYTILHKHCDKVQAMSCDEAILDITNLDVDDPQALASLIRKEIFDTTRCTASVGISNNILMARLATKSAKPNGQCYLPPEKVNDFLTELPVKALPGVGRALEEKLKGRHVKTCGELRMISKDSLQKDFGQKTGDMLWNYGRGIDNRIVGVIQESKSVGADVNWGVRFKDAKDSQVFLLSLCKEVSLRLHGCGVRGRTFTLKVKRRKTDEEPVKYMGCGDCDNLSHSLTVATD